MNSLRKGQVWSYDLIVGSLLFVLAMAILAFFWWSVQTNMAENKDAIIRDSIKVTDVLMSPGIPPNWDQLVNLSNQTTWSSVQQIGLADSWGNSSLSINKIYALYNMSVTNYSYSQSLIRSNYNYYLLFAFRNTSNSNLEQPVLMNGTNLTAGFAYNDTIVKALSRVDRIVVYNNSIVIMRLYLWSNSEAD